MNGSDIFGGDQFYGGEVEDGGYYGNSRVPSHHASPVGAQNAASITPESFHSFQNAPLEQQDPQEARLRGSPFDISDYDESVSYGVPAQQQGQQQPNGQQALQTGAQRFEEDKNGVKSEFSPFFPASEASSTSQSSSWMARPHTNDFFNDGYDYLVKDELDVDLDNGGSVGSHDTDGKVFKKRKEKTSHNVIEKKYRTNINDKIFQLREIVPTLRVAYKRYSGMPVLSQDATDLDGLEPARKLNKASILMKTIEYIEHLEFKCSQYKSENRRLRSNISTPESLRAQTSAAPTAVIPVGQDANTHSNNIRTELPNQFDQYPDSSAYSSVPLPIPQANVAPFASENINDNQGNNNNNNNNINNNDANVNANTDYTSRFLMGGLAMTMGASCFGDTGDMGSARALFAMPIFHFSPHTGFAVSNANGMINFQASIFALLRIMLVVATAAYLLNSIIFSSKRSSDKNAEIDLVSMIPTKDTVEFDTLDHLKQTLRKTFIINKIKYKFNSMERIESRIAKCFAIKLYFRESRFSWCRSLTDKYISKRWSELKQQVQAANLKSKGSLEMGLEWGMITNIASVDDRVTLGNNNLLKYLRTHKQEYELKDFLSLVNSFVLRDRVDELTCVLLKQLVDGEFRNSTQLAQTFHQEHVENDKLLKSMPEEFAVIDCLVNPHKSNCDKLSKLIKIGKEVKPKTLLEEQLVLYSSVMRNLINLQKFDQCSEWVKKMPLRELNESRGSMSIVGFTGMLLMLNSVLENLQEFKQHSLALERVCSDLRVWLGSSLGETLELEARNKLINYCIDKALLCDSLTNYEDDEYEKATEEDEDEEQDDNMTEFEDDKES